MAKKIAIKIDVDTKRGYDEGVPRMLDVFKQENIKATFFFSMGTDNSGKAIRRIFRKGFLTKMLRTKAPSTYGFKTMMYVLFYLHLILLNQILCHFFVLSKKITNVAFIVGTMFIGKINCLSYLKIL